MKLKPILLFNICLLLILSCQVEESNPQEEDDFNLENTSFTIKAQTYDYCSTEWKDSNASFKLLSGNEVLVETELVSDINTIQVPTDIERFSVIVSRLGYVDMTLEVNIDELNNTNNETLVIQLQPKTFEGDIHIESIEDYDEFINSEYGRINGNLILAQSNDIVSLNGFVSLTSIEGGLRIAQMESITSLGGLENLKHVGGDFLVFDNSNLTNIQALQNVACIGDYLWIQNNPELLDLEGLEGLTHLPSDLEIINNEKLNSISGVQNIEQIDGNILIQGNYALTNIDELSGLKTVAANLELGGNGINSLAGLENITSIEGSLTLLEIPIESLDGLNNLTTIEGDLDIYNNSRLYDWCALQTLFNNDGLKGGHLFGNCSFNPTIEEIKDGNCSG